MRWAAGVMALLLATAVAVQHNDPDPELWMTLYAAAAAVSAAVAFGRLPAAPAMIVFAGLAAGTLYLTPALRHVRAESFTGASAGSLGDEEAREVLGILIAALWSGALFMWLRKRAAIGRAALGASVIAALAVPLALHLERLRKAPRVLVDALSSPAAVLRSGDQLVLTVFESGSNNQRALVRVPLGGGGAPARIAGGQMGIPSLALDEAHVYWLSYLEGTLNRAPLAGGGSARLAGGLLRPFGIGVHGSEVFFTARQAGRRALFRVAKTGGDPLVVVADQGGVHSLHVHGKVVFWTTEDAIVKVLATGGAPVILAKQRSRPTLLDVEGDFVYYAVAAGVERVATSGGEPELLAKIPSRVTALGAAEDSVYVGTIGPHGGVMRVPARGGPVVPMADVPEGVSGLAVGSESVFVTTDAKQGKLLAVPR